MVKPRAPETDYSKIADYYDKVRSVPADIWLSKIIEYGKIEASCAVLDIGCGTGRFPLAILDLKHPTILALDPSIEMLKQATAKDRSRDILWVRGDGERLPFRDNSFDCVYMTLVIHHIEDKETALREIYRVLKEEGRFVIMTNSQSQIKKHVLRDFPGVIAIDLRRFPSVPSVKKAMREIGFRDVHHHVVQRQEEYISTDRYLEKVRNKYVSTLTFLNEEEFQRGLKIFQQKILRKYGAQIRQTSGFNFIVGQK